MGGAIGASVNGVLRPGLWMFPLKLIKRLPCHGQCYKILKYKKVNEKEVKTCLCIFSHIWTFHTTQPRLIFLFFCSPLLAWKHLIEIKLFMVSGQIAINTGCQRSVTLTSRGEAVLNCGLEQDITCLNIALLSEKWLL